MNEQESTSQHEPSAADSVLVDDVSAVFALSLLKASLGDCHEAVWGSSIDRISHHGVPSVKLVSQNAFVSLHGAERIALVGLTHQHSNGVVKTRHGIALAHMCTQGALQAAVVSRGVDKHEGHISPVSLSSTQFILDEFMKRVECYLHSSPLFRIPTETGC